MIFYRHVQKSNLLYWPFFCCNVIVTGVILAHTIPFIYDKYEDIIDHHVLRAGDEVQKHYNKFGAVVLSKIPRAPSNEKKGL